MRICFYTFSFFPTIGGSEIILHGLADSLTRRGHTVVVWAPFVRGKNNHIDTVYRLRRYSRPISKRIGVRQTVPWLLLEFARTRYNVLHCHGAYPAAYVGAAVKWMIKVPMVVRPHGSDILQGEWIRQNPRLERRMTQSLQKADRIVAQGQSLKSELLRLGLPDTRVEIIHNGVQRSPVRPVAPAASTREPPYVLSLGSLSQKKGYDLLLRAFYDIATDIPDIRLVIAGGGSRYLELMDLTIKLSLENRVRWMGEVSGERKQQLLEGALAYVCPSRREPFSNALLEAMAAGLPIVATRVGGNAEMLEDDRSAILVPPEDPLLLAGAIRRVIQDKPLRDRLGEESYRRSELFDWDRMVTQYEDLYRRVSGKN